MFSSMIPSLIAFACAALAIVVAGKKLAQQADRLAEQSGLGEAVFGVLLLAVSNIFGTNCFNMLVVAAADVGYFHGVIYHDMAPVQMTWGLVSILMTAILLLGLVRRETYGFGRIGFESVLILGVYAIALVVVMAGG